jgi:hypothetical protein
MNKLFLAALFISSIAFAQENTSTQDVAQNGNFNHRASRWLTTFGFEGTKYQTYGDFDGKRKKIGPREQELWGGRLGLGGQLHLGKGFITTTKLEGYYMGTLFSQVLNGGKEDEDVKFAYHKKTGQIYGGDASQSIGYIFDFKTKNPFLDEWTYLTVEPFIEAGVGVAWAYNRVNYRYELANTDEGYKLRVEDNLTNAKVGVGINFTSNDGYFLYMKATQNQYDVTNRKTYQAMIKNGSRSVSKPEFDDDLKAVTVYAIGGGYKF